MKKEVKILLDKAIASLIISAEHFNRPSDLGRVDAVLILMDHAFEMLLKAAILHKGDRIREPRAKMTIGFDHSVRVGLSDGAVRFLTDEDALLIQTNNGLRDAARHRNEYRKPNRTPRTDRSPMTRFREVHRLIHR